MKHVGDWMIITMFQVFWNIVKHPSGGLLVPTFWATSSCCSTKATENQDQVLQGIIENPVGHFQKPTFWPFCKFQKVVFTWVDSVFVSLQPNMSWYNRLPLAFSTFDFVTWVMLAFLRNGKRYAWGGVKLTFYTGAVDNVWKLVKDEVPPSLSTLIRKKPNGLLQIDVRQWQWRHFSRMLASPHPTRSVFHFSRMLTSPHLMRNVFHFSRMLTSPHPMGSVLHFPRMLTSPHPTPQYTW